MKVLDNENIRDYLRKFFKLIGQRANELYYQKIDAKEFNESKIENYLTTSILESIVRLKEGVSLFVSFLSDYIKGATPSYELFCGLVRAFGYEDYLKIFHKEIKLAEVVDYLKIDPDFFSFQVRTTLDLYLQDAINTFAKTYLKAQKLPKAVDYTKSKFVEKFIYIFENQTKDWFEILDEIYSFYGNKLLKRDLKRMIDDLEKIIYDFIGMTEKLQMVQEFIHPRKGWKELLLEDMQNLGSRIEEIGEDISLIADYGIKYYEHGFNTVLFLLKMLWGSEELALQKVEEFSRFKISTDELIPKEIQLENLKYGLISAITEFNLVGQATDVMKEKIYVLEEAENMLRSHVIQRLYNETWDTIKGHDSSWKKMYETLLTIQDLTVKALNQA